jgi:hypothetical protein
VNSFEPATRGPAWFAPAASARSAHASSLDTSSSALASSTRATLARTKAILDRDHDVIATSDEMLVAYRRQVPLK